MKVNKNNIKFNWLFGSTKFVGSATFGQKYTKYIRLLEAQHWINPPDVYIGPKQNKNNQITDLKTENIFIKRNKKRNKPQVISHENTHKLSYRGWKEGHTRLTNQYKETHPYRDSEWHRESKVNYKGPNMLDKLYFVFWFSKEKRQNGRKL